MLRAVFCIAALWACVHGLAYRLPDTITPKHYILDIITNLDEDNFSFQGKVWIKVTCNKPADTVTLHARDMRISESQVTVKQILNEHEVMPLTVTGQRFVPEHEFYVIKLSEKMAVGKTYIIHLPFEGNLTAGLAGYYRSSYHDRATNTTKWLAVTQFESTDARRAFPCFDEPAMKASFTINLGHKEELKSASNMPIASTTPMEDRKGWVWDRYEDTVPMSTYLVAYIVYDYEYRTSDASANNVTFRVWARKDAISQVEFAREVGPKFLEYYERYFDMKYPLPKQDMVAIPDFNAGAMENWGLITFRETTLLFDEKTSSTVSQHSIASVIAHELAHQWFGNLVTMKWWTDLWLNEGFATYVAGLGVQNEFPEWNSLDSVAVENMLTVYALDSLKSSHPVSVKIGHPSEITQIFDTISYKKGAYLLRMMNLFLGENVFRHGVNAYLKKHRYGNAEQDDLWASLTEHAHADGALSKDITVKEIMDTWTLQTGYPLLTVTRDNDGNVHVSQKRHLAVSNGNEDATKTCWWVPLSYTTEKQLDFKDTMPKKWLNCKMEKLKIHSVGNKNEWLIFNIKAAGLCRVQYDKENWRLLSKALNSDDYRKIDALNRAQLLADVLDLAWLGQLEYEIAIELTRYLEHETEYLPWRSGLNNLQNIEQVLRRTSNFGHFKKFIESLVEPIFAKLGKLTDMPKNFEGVKHKVLITSWACHYRVGNCVDQGLKLFNGWKEQNDPDSTNPVPSDLRLVVYCLGVRYGGEREWEFLWHRYKASNVGTEQSVILQALGCSRDVWILNRYLDWSIEEKSGIRRQDSNTVFASVARNEIGFYLAKNFLFRKIKIIYDYYGPKSSKIGRYVSTLADQMISNVELLELKQFSSANPEELKHSQLSIRQSIESVEVNARWHTKYYATIGELVKP